jgi:competence protein ComQ
MATGGPITTGARVAAAVEIFMAGLDVLDEVEDGDQSPTVEAVGTAQALNIATALLFLGQQTLFTLGDDRAAASGAAFARVLTEIGLRATGGQHGDLASEGMAGITPDEALEIAREKSGRLVGGACRLGAMVGAADGALLDLYETWGQHFGLAAQLANDLHDADHDSAKSDQARQKATLPLLYTRRLANLGPSASGALANSGALHFTWVVLEIERQKCVELLGQLAARGQEVGDLRSLLGRVG